MEGVRDHIVSSLHVKATPYAMWKALTDLFQSISDQRKLALKDKLRKIKMQKNLYRFEVDGISMELPTIGKCEKAM